MRAMELQRRRRKDRRRWRRRYPTESVCTEVEKEKFMNAYTA